MAKQRRKVHLKYVLRLSGNILPYCGTAGLIDGMLYSDNWWEITCQRCKASYEYTITKRADIKKYPLFVAAGLYDE